MKWYLIAFFFLSNFNSTVFSAENNCEMPPKVSSIWVSSEDIEPSLEDPSEYSPGDIVTYVGDTVSVIEPQLRFPKVSYGHQLTICKNQYINYQDAEGVIKIHVHFEEGCECASTGPLDPQSVRTACSIM